MSAADNQSAPETEMVQIAQIAPDERHLFPPRLQHVQNLIPDAEHQVKPVELGQLDGDERLHVIDGSYRLAVMKSIGEEVIKATVRPVDELELSDGRLTALSRHNPVEVKRMVETLEEAWKQRSWAGTMELREVFPRQGGRNASIQKLWLARRSELLGIGTTKLALCVNGVEVVAPEIADRAVIGKLGRSAGFALHGQLLVQIGTAFPDDFDSQRQLADLIVQNKMPLNMAKEFIIKAMADDADLQELSQHASQYATGYHAQSKANREEGHRRRRQQKAITHPVPDGRGNQTNPAYDGPKVTTGPISFSNEAWGARRSELVRVQNIVGLNQQSASLAKQTGHKLNHLLIMPDSRPIFNPKDEHGGITIRGPLETEIINVLLSAYLCPPPTLDELFYKYGLSRLAQKEHAHQFLMQLKFQGISFYDPETEQLATLRPLIIEDRRQTAD